MNVVIWYKKNEICIHVIKRYCWEHKGRDIISIYCSRKLKINNIVFRIQFTTISHYGIMGWYRNIYSFINIPGNTKIPKDLKSNKHDLYSIKRYPTSWPWKKNLYSISQRDEKEHAGARKCSRTNPPGRDCFQLTQPRRKRYAPDILVASQWQALTT